MLNRAKKLLLLTALATLSSVAACSGSDAGSGNSDWELLGNSSDMQHRSSLNQIDSRSIDRLGIAWVSDMPSQDGMVGNPLVKNGVVFQSGALGLVVANDLKTGKILWSSQPEIAFHGLSDVNVSSRRFNRGLALYGNLAIVARGCDLVALDQKTGRQVWQSTSCDSREMLGITAAPRIGGDMVFTGNACGDSGAARSFVDAFDARTGKHRWRFYTVPGDPAKPAEDEVQAMAAKTWGSDWRSKTLGCGSVWDAMTYDRETGLLYLGVGGPAPFAPNLRSADAGDELFSNSIVALDARTGAYKWHFKQVPNDGWNFEPSVGIMAATLPVGGEKRRVVVSVPKNGFVYLLDAKTGKFLSGAAFAPQNWAKGLDKDGRPIYAPEARYWEKPEKSAIVLPGPSGAHGWEAMALDQEAGVLYIPSQVIPTRFTLKAGGLGSVSQDYYAAIRENYPVQPRGELVAWDVVNQREVWRRKQAFPMNGGVLLSGDLVYEGTAEGKLEVFEARTGKLLKAIAIGGAIRGAPSTAMLDGEQYVLVPVGNGNAAVTGAYAAPFGGTPQTRGAPRLVALKLGGQAAAPSLQEPIKAQKPPVGRFPRDLVATGRKTFENYNCVYCHGQDMIAAGGSIPDLRLTPPADYATFRSVVHDGILAERGMPRFAMMTESEARGIFAYIIDRSWDAHEDPDARPKPVGR